MKKLLICLSLALVLVLTAVACTEGSVSDETAAGTGAVTEAGAATTVVTEAATKAATEATTAAATEAATQAAVETNNETVAETNDETVAETNNETVAETNDETVAETNDETVVETVVETNAETPVETAAPVETQPETQPETEPETEPDPTVPAKVYTPDDIVWAFELGNGGHHLVDDDGNYMLVDNGDYVTITPTGGDSQFVLDRAVNGARYIIIKYRANAQCDGLTMQFYTDSWNDRPADDTVMVDGVINGDGEWHLMVLDTQDMEATDMYDGRFMSYFRFDPVDSGYKTDENGDLIGGGGNYERYDLPEGASIDVAFIALCHLPDVMGEVEGDGEVEEDTAEADTSAEAETDAEAGTDAEAVTDAETDTDAE